MSQPSDLELLSTVASIYSQQAIADQINHPREVVNRWLKERTSVRALYAELADTCDACVTLSAPGPAPQGLQATGNPQFAVPSSLLGIPALSLPLFVLDGMPLGLQILGYANGDANAFAIGAWLMKELGGEAG